MSHVDGSIDIRFTGSQAALAKLERFMGEELASFRSFRDCAVSYDPVKHSLDLDLNVRYEDIFSFLGFVVARVPEAGFSGEADLDYVGSGGRYYALYQHEPGGAFQVGENSTDDFREDFLLDLDYAPEADGQVTEWLKTLPFPLKAEADSDVGYYEGDYWVYEKYDHGVTLRALYPGAEELRAFGEALKALAAQVPSLEADTAYHSGAALVVNIHPGQEARVVTVPIDVIPTGLEDEFEGYDD